MGLHEVIKNCYLRVRKSAIYRERRKEKGKLAELQAGRLSALKERITTMERRQVAMGKVTDSQFTGG